MEQLYKELRKPRAEQVDLLTTHAEYAILATEPNQNLVHLDGTPDPRGHSLWTLEGALVQLNDKGDGTFQLQADPFPGEGAVLEHVQTLSSSADIHREFVSAWKKRWQTQAAVDPATWSRILRFTEAFLPQFDISLPPLDLQSWQRAVRRFKPRAARGPCGWSKDDLINLSPSRTAELLQLLTQVEQGTLGWPSPLLVGFVCSLSKDNGKQDVQGFRPIVLYSIIYRCWAGLRSRQVLRALKKHLPPGLLGFVPGKEPAELWYAIQMQIEVSCQQGTELFGLSTDVVKAFNCLPRDPILAIARHVGIPQILLRPWEAFLSGMTRRFLIRGTVGDPIPSDSGFPEGCPLSPLAMLLADLALHHYASRFTPETRCLSFVDNLTCVANSLPSIARGLSMVTTFCESLRLQLDPAKTFLWSTQAKHRPALQVLGTVCTHARELGGFLSFGSTTRNKALTDRCRDLSSLWESLKQSKAPLHQKLMVLPLKCWAKALHGISGCPLPESQLAGLRTAATRALGIRPAGSSPQLRLTLSGRVDCDPGFFQLWTCVKDIRRMAAKIPELLSLWRQFMHSFDGCFYQGPFSKLIQVLSPIGWRVLTPPWVRDHEGLEHDLLTCPTALIRRLLAHAWLQYVSHQHRHRKSMADMQGLDPALLASLSRKLSGLELARLRTLQSGAFITSAHHCKFGLSKTGLCSCCQVPETVQHKVCQCPLYQTARAGLEWAVDAWDSFPSSFTNHLLPPANPYLPRFQALLHELPDYTGTFLCQPLPNVVQHLFTDGACTQHEVSGLRLAAWGVVHAGLHQVLACGQVSGILQSAPRAELCAVLAAVRWTLECKTTSILWVDALHVVTGLHDLLSGGVPGQWENHDLWWRIHAAVSVVPSGAIRVFHVPSHLDRGLTESPFEDWIAANNSHVDTVAGLCNLNRCGELTTLLHRAGEYHRRFRDMANALRQIQFRVADLDQNTAPPAVHLGDLDEVDGPPANITIVARPLLVEDQLTPGWRHQLYDASHSLPGKFLDAVCMFLFQQDELSTTATSLSWLEVVFMLHLLGFDQFPALGPHGTLQVPDDLSFRPLPPTVAGRLSLLRRAGKISLRLLNLDVLLVSGIDRTDCGVDFPLDGVILGVQPDLLLKARSLLSDFTKGRKLGCHRALARPV